MPELELAPHVERIARALNTNDKEELEHELRKFLEYGVPIEQAVQTLLRQRGATVQREATKLADLQGSEPYVVVVAKVLSVNTKEVTANGEKKTILWGLVGDDTATMAYTDWKGLNLVKGEVVKFNGAYTKEWQGRVQVNFGERVQVERLPPEAMPTTKRTLRASTIADLKPNAGGYIVTARVLTAETREVTVREAKKTIVSGTLADATGRIPFTAWHPFDLKAGGAVRISGAYVKAFRGAPQLAFDQEAQVEFLPQDAVPASDGLGLAPVEISKLLERGGGNDLCVEGTVLEVRPGSGLVFRCPECNRVAQKGACRLHGKVNGLPDMRIKAVIDDGTGSLSAVLGRELTERLLGRDLAAAQKMASEAMSVDVVEEELRGKLVATSWRFVGNALSDDFGVMLLVREAEPAKKDVIAEARKLLGELEAA